MNEVENGSVEDTDAIQFDTGLEGLGGDVVFLPIGPDGETEALGQQILDEVGLDRRRVRSSAYLLERGYIIANGPSGKLCYVVSAGLGTLGSVLSANLTAALGDKELMQASSLWLPLMGLGPGRLSAIESEAVTISALRATGWLQRPSVRIVIARPFDPTNGGQTTAHAIGVAAAVSGVVGESAHPQEPLGDPDADGSLDEEVKPSVEAPASSALEPAFEPAANAALGFAAALSFGRQGGGGQLSTTCLLFSLAESQSGAAPPALRSDLYASLFSGAVHVLARDGYRVAWTEYFEDGFKPTTDLTLPERLPAFTANVREVIQGAVTRAISNKRNEVSLADLILSLLDHASGRHATALERMGTTLAELKAAYQDALVGQIGTKLLNDVAANDDKLGYVRYATAITRFLLDADSPPPLSVSIQAPWGAGKSSLMLQIREALDPKLVRDQFRPKLGETPPRLLLRQVVEFLDRQPDSGRMAFWRWRKRRAPDQTLSNTNPTDRLWTIWFNAWKYDSSEQVWAGMVDAIVGQISERLAPIEREKFLLRLQLARIDDGIIRRKIYDRVLTIWWARVRRWTLLCASIVGGLFGIHKVVEILSPQDVAVLKLFEWSPYAPLVFLGLYLTGTYFATREKLNKEPASFSLSEYLKVPDYDLSVGTIHHIHQDLLRVLRVTPSRVESGQEKASPLVIFIDDLDRCSPSKIGAVVEGVSMFLASEDYRCFFVIGMDPQMIAAALEDAHAKVRSQLPRYERTVPLGWRFMDKFIQLPFTIPPSSGDALKGYIDDLGGTGAPMPSDKTLVADVLRDAAGRAASTLSGAPGSIPTAIAPRVPPVESTTRPKPATIDDGSLDSQPAPAASSALDSKSQAAFVESREVGQIIQAAASNTSGNPREIKRLANLTRLYLGLRNERRATEPTWRSPGPNQYARWIVLTLRWPDMMRWLQWGADEFAWPQAYRTGDLATRRLRLLEDTAQWCTVAEDWTNILVTNLKVPGADESDWATDPKLFEFFAHEATFQPEARLSAAAAHGLW